eukprot:GHVP01034997.1.p1 GENE.GHVP01034997.1~~GHVP01034997.1.p1  ORF type:complete len:192 (+),score=33.86 GHVP01034997.1:189-764(+)
MWKLCLYQSFDFLATVITAMQFCLSNFLCKISLPAVATPEEIVSSKKIKFTNLIANTIKLLITMSIIHLVQGSIFLYSIFSQKGFLSGRMKPFFLFEVLFFCLVVAVTLFSLWIMWSFKLLILAGNSHAIEFGENKQETIDEYFNTRRNKKTDASAQNTRRSQRSYVEEPSVFSPDFIEVDLDLSEEIQQK